MVGLISDLHNGLISGLPFVLYATAWIWLILFLIVWLISAIGILFGDVAPSFGEGIFAIVQRLAVAIAPPLLFYALGRVLELMPKPEITIL